MSWQPEVDEVRRRRELALELGGAERVKRHHEAGKLTIRERIDRLVDPNTFQEVGRLTGSATYVTGKLEKLIPAPYVMGLARIAGRFVAIGGEDFTVRGGSSAGLDRRKGGQGGFIEDLAYQYRIPLINLIDGAGGSVTTVARTGHAHLPGVDTFQRAGQLLGWVPVIGAVLGSSAGGPAARAVLSHWSVMVEGTGHAFSAGPAVVERALGQRVSKEELGGVEVAVDTAGCIHNRAADEEEAFGLMRRYLSYMPQNVWELPPRTMSEDPPERREEELLSIVPRNRRHMYDMRKLIQLIVDRDSCFEIQPTYGKTVITCLARLNGYAVGVVANNPMVFGGALDAPGARKTEHFIEVCDTFHLPILFPVDTPGFMIGRPAEQAATLPAGVRALYVAHQATVPKISLIVRKCYGMGGMIPTSTDALNLRLAWPSAEWGSLPIEGGVAVAYRREIEQAADPAKRLREIEEELRALNSPFRTAEAFGVEDIIDPRETRPLLCRFIEAAQAALRGELGLKPRAGVRP
ncbi:MAG: acyl-CoA carboxylase subunit beta [Candidatus Methylomirabilia bacterium]